MSSSRCKQSGCSKTPLSGKDYCLDHHKSQENYAYGMDYELQKKMEAKWDPEKAKNAQTWIETVTKKKFSGSFQDSLKSGALLCELINVIWPGTIKTIQTSSAPFVQRENIVAYLNACKNKGMRETDLFVTQDLFEGSNLNVVVDNICALGVLAANSGFKGTALVVSGGAVQTTAPAGTHKKTGSYGGSNQGYASTPSTTTTNNNNTTTTASKPAATTSTSSSSSSSSVKPKFCGECGKPRTDAKFCGECGAKFT
jgi:hypothetical protein